jgi:GNAT superfamily N-acetyltransferase
MPISIQPAAESDIPALAKLRAQECESESYWNRRITAYLHRDHSSRQAHAERAIFTATENKCVVGFVAGHLTRRYGCDGELEWINVDRAFRRQGVATLLLPAMWAWFLQHRVLRVCVDVTPENTVARRFYAKHGARPLHPHWMAWDDIHQIVMP